MKIGIDIDDTITKTGKRYNHLIRKYQRKHNLPMKPLKENEYEKFLEEYGEKIFKKLPLKKQSVKVIKKWLKEGHEIYFVTTRNNKMYKNLEKDTKEQFKQIKVQSIIFSAQNKYQATKDLNLDIFIDDRESVLDTFPKNTKTYLFRFVPNKEIYSKYPKIKSWKELALTVENL